MSRRRQGVLLRKYSELPSRYTRRVTRTSCQSTCSSLAQLPNVTETSAKPTGLRMSLPLKITSAISSPRSDLADCSPSTQRTASSTLDFPQPFGPTMAVIPSWKLKVVLSANDLKPSRSSDCKCMRRPKPRGPRRVNIERLLGLQAKFAPFEVVSSVDRHMILCPGQAARNLEFPTSNVPAESKAFSFESGYSSCSREFADEEK